MCIYKRVKKLIIKLLVFMMCASLVLTTIVLSEDTVTKGTMVGVTDKLNFEFDSESGIITKYIGSDTKIIIPRTINGVLVKYIAGHAFFDSGIESVTIPDSVVHIGSYAFEWCNNLKEINVDSNNENYTSVDGILFNKAKTQIIKYPSNKQEKTYIVPANVKEIAEGSFMECDITGITIPEGVTSIGQYAFNCCDSLISITIPNSVTSIGVGISDDSKNNMFYVYSKEIKQLLINSGVDESKIILNKPVNIEGLKDLQITKGQTISPIGKIKSQSNITKVTLSVEGWYGGEGGTGNYLSLVPTGKTFDLSKFKINTNDAAFKEIKDYKINVWVKNEEYPSGIKIGTFTLKVKNAQPTIEGLKDLEVKKGQTINPVGVINSQSNLTKVTLSVEGWNGGEGGTGNYLSLVPTGKTFDLSKFKINTNDAVFKEIKDYKINVWVKNGDYPSGVKIGTFAINVKKATGISFSDVSKTHYAYNDIIYLAQKGIVKGYTDGTFKPNNPITRAEFAAMLCRTFGEEYKGSDIQSFVDVQKNSWSYKYAEAVKDYFTSYLNDNNQEEFRPNEYMLREDGVVIFIRYLGLDDLSFDTTSLEEYADKEDITYDLRGEIAKGIKLGIVKGYIENNKKLLKMRDNLTRAEACTIICNILRKEGGLK